MSDYKLGIENDKLRVLLNDYENELSRTKREAREKIQDLETENKELRHRLWRFKQFVFQQRLAGQFNQHLSDLEDQAEKFSEKGE